MGAQLNLRNDVSLWDSPSERAAMKAVVTLLAHSTAASFSSTYPLENEPRMIAATAARSPTTVACTCRAKHSSGQKHSGDRGMVAAHKHISCKHLVWQQRNTLTVLKPIFWRGWGAGLTYLKSSFQIMLTYDRLFTPCPEVHSKVQPKVIKAFWEMMQTPHPTNWVWQWKIWELLHYTVHVCKCKEEPVQRFVFVLNWKTTSRGPIWEV